MHCIFGVLQLRVERQRAHEYDFDFPCDIGTLSKNINFMLCMNILNLPNVFLACT